LTGGQPRNQEAPFGNPDAGDAVHLRASLDGLPHLSAAAVRSIISPTQALLALEHAIERDGVLRHQHRTRLEPPGGEMLLMPAVGPEGAGAKLITLAPENPKFGLPLIQGVYVLFSPAHLTPEMTIDGGALTQLRTAAVSALATHHLARTDSRRLVVFGAGRQAEAHVEAMCGVRQIREVTIVGSSPTSVRANALVKRLRADGLDAKVGDPGSVRHAEIVCTCTTSVAPVFDASLLPPGAHVNAVGAYRPDMCELAGPLLARALLVVETRAAAFEEAGDIIRAIAAGELSDDGIDAELSDVVTGASGRSAADQVTVFKSVGLAIEDLVIARAIADLLLDRPASSAAVD
jgi:ornithine cyclodeaminase/alanine dehydrogenase-like protein (mu-crystallin family)